MAEPTITRDQAREALSRGSSGLSAQEAGPGRAVMDYADLIGRLKDFARGDWSSDTVNEITAEAADALAALTRERDEARARLAVMLDDFGGYNTPSVDSAILHMLEIGLDVWSMQRLKEAENVGRDKALSSLKREVLAMETLGDVFALKKRLSRADGLEDK